MFEATKEALDTYVKSCEKAPITWQEEFRQETAALDIAKAFVYEIGYDEASKFANAILALGQLHPLR